MRVLVTGGNGMLGRAVTKALNLANYEVLNPTRLELNLEDRASTSKYFITHQFEAIIHCAAQVGGISANIDNPVDFLQKNLIIDQNIFLAAIDFKVTNLLYIGSSCMYPKDRDTPMNEGEILTGPLEPTNESYALAKIVGWKNVQLMSTTFRWRTLVLSNLYGPNDHFEPTRSHLLAAIIHKVYKAKIENYSELEMWGSGAARREFTYVSDVADFITVIIPQLEGTPNTLNVGTGVDYSVREYYEMVCEELDYNGRIVSNFEKPEGMKRKLMDVSKAKEFGWAPKTNIKDGIKKTVEWYLANEMSLK